jgi:Activator of Hsp90 ATPase homolog 1-like protein
MSEKHEPTAPIVKEVQVDCPPHEAFRLFVFEIEQWWPMSSQSGDQDHHLTMEPGEGGRLYEWSDSGQGLEWGTVLRWDPPREVTFSWHPARDTDTGERVTVEFVPAGIGTRIILTHIGWETALMCSARMAA